MFCITKLYIGFDKELAKCLVKESEVDKAKMLHKFRLYDGDYELYFEGYSDDNSSFEPLDWGMADSGCTEIRYLENGQWVEL